jgi:hypothetical protein
MIPMRRRRWTGHDKPKCACSTQELTMHVMAERGMNAADKRLVKTASKRAGVCPLPSQQGVLRSVEGLGDRFVWESCGLLACYSDKAAARPHKVGVYLPHISTACAQESYRRNYRRAWTEKLQVLCKCCLPSKSRRKKALSGERSGKLLERCPGLIAVLHFPGGVISRVP